MPNPQATDTPFVLSELSEGVCWLTLNRPKQRNPLSSSMIAVIKQEIDAASDNPQVRVITGGFRAGILRGPRFGGNDRANPGEICDSR